MVTRETLLNQTTTLSDETHWEKAARTRMGKYLTRLETDFISKAIDPSKASIVVDVGAEAGRFSLMAANSNITVIAIDIDAYSLRRLKLKNKNVSVIQADARKIPFKNDSFDGVIMIEVLDYIPQIDEALGECSRVLKSKSPLVLSFGNQSSIKAKLRGFRGKSYMHSYRKVISCLVKTGFVVTAKLGYSWLPFGRTSQSRLVPFLSSGERIFGLRRIPSFSPWVILRATKSP
jgi:ubiquinone/menaquinone biosynthesis C-methylase UbiE